MPSALETLLGLSAQGGGGADALQLSSLRGRRRSELIPRAEAGDPLAINRLSTLDEEIASDPFTGEAEQSRVADIESGLGEATTFARPEIAGMRQTKEQDVLRRLLMPARAKAEVEASQDARQFAQQLMRDRLNNQALARRQIASAGIVSQRSQATQQAQMARAQLNNLMRERMAAQKELGKVGMVDKLFGRAKPHEGRIAQLTQQIQGLGAQTDTSADFSPEEAAQALAAKFPGASLQDLMSKIEVDSPAEAEAVQAMLMQLGYE